jgi:hypothetical protein
MTTTRSESVVYSMCRVSAGIYDGHTQQMVTGFSDRAEAHSLLFYYYLISIKALYE